MVDDVGVFIVIGDIKVVGKGLGDGVFIIIFGIGVIELGCDLLVEIV